MGQIVCDMAKMPGEEKTTKPIPASHHPLGVRLRVADQNFTFSMDRISDRVDCDSYAMTSELPTRAIRL